MHVDVRMILHFAQLLKLHVQCIAFGDQLYNDNLTDAQHLYLYVHGDYTYSILAED